MSFFEAPPGLFTKTSQNRSMRAADKFLQNCDVLGRRPLPSTNAMPQRCQACTRRVGVPGEFFRNGTPTLTKKATLSMEKNLAPQKLNTTKQPNLRNG